MGRRFPDFPAIPIGVSKPSPWSAREWWTLPAAKAGVNRTLYFFAGAGLRIDGESIPAKHAVEMRGDAKAKLECGAEDCEMLLLQGRPIGEPVAQRGPFVMNTDAEIGQAFEEYRKTRFGGWPWPTHEPVHSREKGRFARYADGTETIRPG
jgi:quercetin 2,3-dioxygenase